jgi:hypothetical protein
MVHLLRRFQQPLLIMITVFVIISFVAFYNTSSRFMDRQGGEHAGSIYGAPVTMSQAQKVVRKFEVAQQLGLGDLLLATETAEPRIISSGIPLS